MLILLNYMVGCIGIEPITLGLRTDLIFLIILQMSTFCLLFKNMTIMLVITIINNTDIIGGPWGDRTPDLGIKSQTLYQKQASQSIT